MAGPLEWIGQGVEAVGKGWSDTKRGLFPDAAKNADLAADWKKFEATPINSIARMNTLKGMAQKYGWEALRNLTMKEFQPQPTPQEQSYMDYQRDRGEYLRSSGSAKAEGWDDKSRAAYNLTQAINVLDQIPGREEDVALVGHALRGLLTPEEKRKAAKSVARSTAAPSPQPVRTSALAQIPTPGSDAYATDSGPRGWSAAMAPNPAVQRNPIRMQVQVGQQIENPQTGERLQWDGVQWVPVP